ncbi:putative ran guanine nucleotide release factor [Canna indica]|uniref:Ran guanine nucleotide release factor n=1 Tax=Canna indica TaxID=4628 RepID=A0AAQ3K333_9LILI|nr:putative ran guanine nucleotide release factor [Canna indica]
MNGEDCVQRPLFGGAISSWFPLRLQQDLSNITHVPDHQEVFSDPQQDESLVFELLELKHDVEDSGSAVRFLRDLAGEQDALETMNLPKYDRLYEYLVEGLASLNSPAIATTAVGLMVIAKGRQGREVQNLVRVYVANLRLQGISTDVVISAYEPILIDMRYTQKLMMISSLFLRRFGSESL